LARDYFRPSRLAPTFPRDRAGTPRENGEEGMSEGFDPASWKLYVAGVADDAQATATDPSSGEPALALTLAQIRALPRVEMVTELKCIEGWSQVVHWSGARFADFAARYPPAPRDEESEEPRNPANWPGYVSLVTPDDGYYVGLDLESALHPQTLLCYEMNGKPLAVAHGAPLRLVIPVKYGIKHLKRIGTIRYTDRRPADYWAERGYDWYAGH
jgi:DMSO/TMAO reductase YedYZ molybdopterin-dependent catalytic subunit